MADLTVHPVDPSRWDDLATLFGPSGAQRGCWCMFWRRTSSEFNAATGADNRAALAAAVAADGPVGLLGYLDGVPAGWCAIAPRPAYRRVLNSTQLRPDPDDGPDAWSVTCFFIGRGHRRSGLSGHLLAAAVEHARAQGARFLEGYPVDTKEGTVQGDIHSGTIGLFTRAGFSMYRRPPTGRRVVMRMTFAPRPDREPR